MHKWLALIIGFQLLLWFASGALMAWLPIGEVRGEHLVDRARAEPLTAELARIDPAILARIAANGAEAITLRRVDGRLVAEVGNGDTARLFDLLSGQPVGPLDAAAAQRIANAAWTERPPAIAGIRPVRARSTEYRAALPAWRIGYADAENTAVYVAALTGRITAVRTGTWRLYDFFWGLHIMDWKDHEDFNTPWLFGFALGGLVIGLSGTLLLLARWPIRRRRAGV
ncbi:hypothetical protein GVO57_10370 [Sphingomonas changnyeongensis]|uniref:PepSY domain-containing protein n=1 Tax=Sphingomonas changnyeongensis TaxID=2698679 RepID=A0A7Z2SAJ6_9SPHN|nr:hypothetical protein GVO57_10370 [Sphingomonas changnyeongensis]